VALDPAERVQQRQRPGQAGQRAVADVHPDVAVTLDQRVQDLAGQARGDLVAVQALQRDVPLAEPQRLPDRAPEGDRGFGVRELAGGGLAEQLGADAQQAVDDLRQVVPGQAGLAGDVVRVVIGQEGLGLHVVGPAVDAGQLVGGQVVVDVGDVDQEGLAGQEAERDAGAGGVHDQRTDPLAVMFHRLSGAFQDVRGVVAHQVPQPAVVVAAVPAVQLEELIQPGPGLAAVPDAEFQDVQLVGQRAAGGQVVPDPEQLQDQLAGGLGVPRVALTARQRLLVLLARRPLPVGQGLPVQRVEPPDAAVPAGHPGFEGQPARVLQRVLDRRFQVQVAAAAQVYGELGAGGSYRPADHGLAEVLLVLDPVAHHAQPGQVGGRRADRLDDRAERGPGRGRLAQLADRPEIKLHLDSSSRSSPGSRRCRGCPGRRPRYRLPAGVPRPRRGSRPPAG
jgi:hypothetical protein